MKNFSLIKKAKELIADYKIDPEWQRNADLWSKKNTNTYLKDLLAGKPMPPILTYHDPANKECIVLDGKQRITNIQKALKDASFTNKEKKTLENYPFIVNHYSPTYFKSEGLFDSEKIVDFFYKTNALGSKPNSQEIRRALHYKKPYIKFVKKERDSKRFKNFLSQFDLNDKDLAKIRLRFLDEEFILKVLCYYFNHDLIKSPYTNLIIDNVVSKKTMKNLDECLGEIFEVFDAVYEGTDIPKRIPFVSKYKGVMPIILGVLAQYDTEEILENREPLITFLNDFWFLNHDGIAAKHNFTFNSGSGFYRAVINLIVDKMDVI